MRCLSRGDEIMHALKTPINFTRNIFFFLEMGVMPELGQAVEEMDWRSVIYLMLCLYTSLPDSFSLLILAQARPHLHHQYM